MGLIIKNKIAQLKKGYPTVSDKYNVQGGIYVGDTSALYFGDLVFTSGVTGHYVKFDEAAENAKLAGIALATNVKLANRYPGDSNAKVETLKGEAFNLLVRGFVAVALEDATFAQAVLDYESVIKDPEATAQEKKEAIDAFEQAKKDALATVTEGAAIYLTDNGNLAIINEGGEGDAPEALDGVYCMGVAEIIDNELVAEINYKM